MTGIVTNRAVFRAMSAERDLIDEGFYSAAYFTKLENILRRDGHDPIVTMQVFQRGEGILAGVDRVINILLEADPDLVIHALPDGSTISPNETVMTIKGRLQTFARLESVYLGILARMTRVATNTRAVVDAANGKPILFAADRFDVYSTQMLDGEAALLGGAEAICTEAMGFTRGATAAGTMPHALIAAYGGDTALAAQKYRQYRPGEPVVALTDFHNDCVTTSLEVARELGPDLHAVRLDTSGNMEDASITWDESDAYDPDALEMKGKGVCPQLVLNVREALDSESFQHVKIIASGGFTPEKIRKFEALGIPVDMYLVGSSLIKNGQDFTADIVIVDGEPCSKVGRQLNPNDRLVRMTDG